MRPSHQKVVRSLAGSFSHSCFSLSGCNYRFQQLRFPWCCESHQSPRSHFLVKLDWCVIRSGGVALRALAVKISQYGVWPSRRAQLCCCNTKYVFRLVLMRVRQRGRNRTENKCQDLSTAHVRTIRGLIQMLMV